MLWTKCKAVMAMVLVAGLATGCSQQKMSMENMKAPERPKELDKLDFFVGTWTGTSEMKMPGSDKPMTGTGTATYSWDLDRRFLVMRGEYDMGQMGKMSMMSLHTWDPSAKKYFGWGFDSWGMTGTTTMTYDEAAKTWKMWTKGTDCQGQSTVGEGTIKVIDPGTMEMSFAEWDSWKLHKKMEMKDTSKKK